MAEQCTSWGAAPPRIAARVRHVLVGPQSAGNVGAAARAMKNLGFDRLVLADPRCDPADEEARRFAVDARDLLQRCQIAPTLDAALEGARWVAGWTARTGRHRKPHWTAPEFRAPLAEAIAAGGEIAFVFGREDSGLTDRELDACTHLVSLPASESYSSFNLAQAVLLASYEFCQTLGEPSAPEGPADATLAGLAGLAGVDAPAPHEEREAMFAHLERALSRIGFLHDQNEEAIMRRIRRLIGRSAATSQEIRVLRGIARQIDWAAGQPPLPTVPEDSDG